MISDSPTPDLDRIKEVLKKLAVLAKRGEENERQTALEILNRLLQKYNITLPDLINRDEKEREFNFSSRENLTILAQCIWSVNADAHVSFDSGKNKVFVSLKSSDYIEVVEKFIYFYPLYEKEKMKLMLAFVCKHGLTTSPTGNSKGESNMSKDEMAQVVQMMQGMNNSSFATTRKMVERKTK